MRAGPRAALAVLLLAFLSGTRSAAPSAERSPVAPQEEPSAALVARGAAVYRGPGTCYYCHGQDGRGLPRLGSDLTDDRWQFVDGSFASIVALIEAGLTAERSTHGMPMPPRAGAPITAADVRAVAAYAWSLSRRGL